MLIGICAKFERAESRQLRVVIGEIPALQQWIVGEVDPGNDVLGAERDLFGFGKEIVRIAVEHQAPHGAQRHQFLGDELRRVKDVESSTARHPPREQLHLQFHSGNSPPSMASHRSRRWKSGSAPISLLASSQTRECVPSRGVQWNLTRVARPSAFTKRNVWTPKPCIIRSCAGSRGRSSATAACASTPASATRSPRTCHGRWTPEASVMRLWLHECTRSGNFIASWMKNTGMLLPTRSQLPSSV